MLVLEGEVNVYRHIQALVDTLLSLVDCLQSSSPCHCRYVWNVSFFHFFSFICVAHRQSSVKRYVKKKKREFFCVYVRGWGRWQTCKHFWVCEHLYFTLILLSLPHGLGLRCMFLCFGHAQNRLFLTHSVLELTSAWASSTLTPDSRLLETHLCTRPPPTTHPQRRGRLWAGFWLDLLPIRSGGSGWFWSDRGGDVPNPDPEPDTNWDPILHPFASARIL